MSSSSRVGGPRRTATATSTKWWSCKKGATRAQQPTKPQHHPHQALQQVRSKARLIPNHGWLTQAEPYSLEVVRMQPYSSVTNQSEAKSEMLRKAVRSKSMINATFACFSSLICFHHLTGGRLSHTLAIAEVSDMGKLRTQSTRPGC